jgi:hypothetical protein
LGDGRQTGDRRRNVDEQVGSVDEPSQLAGFGGNLLGAVREAGVTTGLSDNFRATAQGPFKRSACHGLDRGRRPGDRFDVAHRVRRSCRWGD